MSVFDKCIWLITGGSFTLIPSNTIRLGHSRKGANTSAEENNHEVKRNESRCDPIVADRKGAGRSYQTNFGSPGCRSRSKAFWQKAAPRTNKSSFTDVGKTGRVPASVGICRWRFRHRHAIGCYPCAVSEQRQGP